MKSILLSTLYFPLFTFCFLLSPSLSSQSKRIIDLHELAAKSRTEVEKVLGPPTKKDMYKVEEGCTCERIFYLEGELFITYFEGKADLIWASTSKLKIINFANMKIRAYHNNYNWVKFFCINSETRKCCPPKNS